MRWSGIASDTRLSQHPNVCPLCILQQILEALAAREYTARRLISIPGIGTRGATTILAVVGDGEQFRRGRDLAAWLGLVPKQYSTGGKPTLLCISKRGNPPPGADRVCFGFARSGSCPSGTG
jgi:hypothetical protein